MKSEYVNNLEYNSHNSIRATQDSIKVCDICSWTKVSISNISLYNGQYTMLIRGNFIVHICAATRSCIDILCKFQNSICLFYLNALINSMLLTRRNADTY
jgi:hypothetical protein